MVGRTGMFTSGLGVFTAASVLCGVADERAVLIAARALQGVGGAMTSAVAMWKGGERSSSQTSW